MGSSATKKQLASAEAASQALRSELRAAEDEVATLRTSLQTTEDNSIKSEAVLSTIEQAESSLRNQLLEQQSQHSEHQKKLAQEEDVRFDECGKQVQESLGKAVAEEDRAAQAESMLSQVKVALAEAQTELQLECDAREAACTNLNRVEQSHRRSWGKSEEESSAIAQVAVTRAELRHHAEEQLATHLEASLALGVEAIAEDSQRTQSLRMVCLENELKSLRSKYKQQEVRLRDFEFVRRVTDEASWSELNKGNDFESRDQKIGDVGMSLETLEQQLAVADNFATAHCATLASAYIAAGQMMGSGARHDAIKDVRDRLRKVHDEHEVRKMQSIAVADAISNAKIADVEFASAEQELVRSVRADLLFKEERGRDAEVQIRRIESTVESEGAIENEVDAALQMLREEDIRLKVLEETLVNSRAEARVESDAAFTASRVMDEVRFRDSQLREVAEEIVTEVAQEKQAKAERMQAVEDELVDALDAEERCEEAAYAVAAVASETRGKRDELRSLQASLEEAELRHEALANTASSVAEILDSELEQVAYDLLEAEEKAESCRVAEMKASSAHQHVRAASNRLWVVRDELESEQMKVKWHEAQAALQLLRQRHRRRLPVPALSRLVQPCFEPLA